MGQTLDTAVVETTGLADDGTEQLTVKTGDSADAVYIFIDDTNGNAHAGYELLVEKFDPEAGASGRWVEFTSVGSDGSPETARSWTDPAIGDQMRFTLTNRSGGNADTYMGLEVTR